MSSTKAMTESQLKDAQRVVKGLEDRIAGWEAKRKDQYAGVQAAIQVRSLEPELRQARQEVASLERELRRLDDEDELYLDGLRREERRQLGEERSFWFRRFHTSLALAHGAGFAAVSSKLFDATVTPATASGAWYPMAAFAAGMILAGLIPVALFRGTQRLAWVLAIASAALFIAALIAALAAVWVKAGLVWTG